MEKKKKKKQSCVCALLTKCSLEAKQRALAGPHHSVATQGVGEYIEFYVIIASSAYVNNYIQGSIN